MAKVPVDCISTNNNNNNTKGLNDAGDKNSSLKAEFLAFWLCASLNSSGAPLETVSLRSRESEFTKNVTLK